MESFFYRRNKYDNYILILIVSLAFGAIGGALQMPRLFCILLFPFFIEKYTFIGKYIKLIVITIVCFLFYCSFSLIWTPDISEGFKDLIYYIVHFILFLEIIAFSRLALNPIKSISTGWLIAVLLTIIIAMWEFQTGNHLPYCRNDADSVANLGNGVFVQAEYAAVAFTNLNTYVTFLCLAIPFLLFIVANKKEENRIVYLIAIVLILISTYCILKNGSRGGFLSIIVQAGIYFLMKPKNKNWIIVVALLSAFFIFVFTRYGDDFIYISSRVSNGNLTEGGVRFEIWEYALERLIESGGFGVGIGGMYEAMQGVPCRIYITHNFFIEVLLIHGLIFFIVFVYFVIKLLIYARRVKEFPIKVTLYSALISFPIWGIVNSGYLSHPFVFVGLASLFVYSDYKNILFSKIPHSRR